MSGKGSSKDADGGRGQESVRSSRSEWMRKEIEESEKTTEGVLKHYKNVGFTLS